MRKQQSIKEESLRQIGLPTINAVPWGTHILQMYQTQKDLLDVILPFMVNGLKHNEVCLWSVSKPLTVQKAKERLTSVLPEIEEYLLSDQLHIVTDLENYCADESFDYQIVLSKFLHLEQEALENNYDGLRVTGTSLWAEKYDWNTFMNYEKEVNKIIQNGKMIALCSYPVENCTLSDFIEATLHHQHVLIHDRGKWQAILTHNELMKRLKETEQKYIELLESEVTQQTKDIKKLLKQKDEFINQLGHDLKNPLGPLVQLIPLLQNHITNEKDLEMLDVIWRNSKYIQNLVDKTLKLAKLNSSNVKYHFEKTNIHEIVSNIFSQNTLLFDTEEIQVENHVSPDFYGYIDPGTIEEVFTNILTNGVKYTDGPGTIIVDAEDQDDSILISIRDNGIGLTEEQIDYLFDEYYKANGSRNDLKCSGLGLSISKRIIEGHHGQIWVESEGLGKGSTFYFSLPKSKS